MSTSPLLGELSSLAAQVVGEDISVVIGDPGCSWSWNWEDREITVCPEDLSARSADVCRAVLMHECAHAAITRIHDLLDLERCLRYQDLLNILEDMRIEEWLAARFPGCTAWLTLANKVFGENLRKSSWPKGYQHQFLRGLIEECWFGNIMAGAAPSVLDALTETRTAVLEIKACLPAPAKGRSVLREILRSQQDMLEVFLARIVPVWERLVQTDALADRPRHTSCDVEFLARAGHGPNGRRLPVDGRNTGEHAGDYLSRQRILAGLIDPLANELIRLFQLNGRAREARGQPSGSKLDLRTVMQFEADPKLYDKIWIRQKRPHRFDPAIFLLLDTSGSMKGEKFEGAFDGIVLLSEVSMRVGLPLSVWTFSNKVDHVLPFSAKGDQWCRKRLDGVRHHLGNSTDLSSCLRSVRRSKEILLHSHPVVIVLSDGEPNDRPSAKAEIQKFKAGRIPCIGIGIGPKTAGLRSLFPYALTEISAQQVASQLVKILGHAIVERFPAAA